MSNFIRDQQQNQKPDIQFQQHTQRRLPISIKMQTPGKATRRRSPCCTVNPLLNPLLPLQCPPTPRAQTAMPRTSAPGCLPSSLPQPGVSHQVLTSHFHVLWHLELRKESQHCTRAAAPAVGWQGPAKPFSHPSLSSAPLVHSWFGQTGFWGVVCLDKHQQWGGERHRGAQARSCPRQGSRCSWCPPHAAERGCSIGALPALVPPALAHTSRVFLLLFIHGEIAHP